MQTTGPKSAGFIKRMEFGPVRVVARLRQEGSAPALELADWIEEEVSKLPQQVAAEVESVTPKGPVGMVGPRMVRITPPLLSALKGMELRLELCRNISARLLANPEWISLEKLLW